MKRKATNTQNCAPMPETMAIHVLHQLTTIQKEGRRADFAEIATNVCIRRFELRQILVLLDRQGLLDASSNSLTLAGFAAGLTIDEKMLPPLRCYRPAARAA